MPSSRRPPWLHLICTPNNLAHLKPKKCDGCGQWTIQCRANIWESYDAGIITGDDIIIAIILGRPLTRIQWIPGLGQIRLLSTFGASGIVSDGAYLSPHQCGHAPVSLTPYKPHQNQHAPAGGWKPEHKPTVEEINIFEHVWNTPLNELEAAK